ncbi:MAG: S1 RNA-binding domain-containing protein, partial [Planctomycetes bacterium]|nr:S1 RNA-binding domain-containing protein [Planctomycetota bacterium]
MVNRNLIRELELGDELDQELELAMAGAEAGEYSIGTATLAVNSVLEGKVLRVDSEFVLVDVGYKSEGHIPRNEWDDSEPPPQVGDIVKVLLEEFEDGQVEEQRGLITLSKRKARRIEDWLRVMESVHENDVVTGFVTRKIKGGLLVDISGVNVFLPASQVDIRRPADIGDYCGRAIQCLVLKIDEARRNIVVSRRALIEQERAERKKQLMETLEVGQ